MLSIIKLRIMNLKNEYMIIVVMTGLALFLTFIMGSAQNGDFRSTVLIVDEDNSNYSNILIDEVTKNEAFKYEIKSLEEARNIIDSKKALTALVITKGYESNILENINPNITLIKVKDDMEIFTLQSIVNSISNKMINNINFANESANYISSENSNIDKVDLEHKIYSRLSDGMSKSKHLKVSTSLINVTGNYDNLKHTVIGFSLFFSMYTMVFSIGTILNDRKYRTWQRMLISPINNKSILSGSMIVAYLVGFLQITILIIAGKYIFNIDWGNSIFGIMLIGSSFVFTVTSLGLFLSGIVKTQAQLSAIVPVILTSTSMLGGCMWPLEIVNSKMLLTLANITPQKWAVEGMEKIAMYGEGFNASIKPSLILIIMGMILFSAGTKLIKYE